MLEFEGSRPTDDLAINHSFGVHLKVNSKWNIGALRRANSSFIPWTIKPKNFSWARLQAAKYDIHVLFIRNHFISNLVPDSQKFKKLLELHVFFKRNHFISNLVLDSQKFQKLLELHVFFKRNHFISNLVLDSQKFQKLLELQRKELRNFRQITHCT